MSRAAFHTPAVHSGNTAQLFSAVRALNDFYDLNTEEDIRREFPRARSAGFCRECHHSCGHAIGCPEYAEADESEVE
jgi:hypothetical protein